MKIKHIKQGPLECGPAVVAMATGITLAKAKKILLKSGWIKKNGATRKELLTAFDHLKYDCAYSDGSYLKKHYKRSKSPCLLLVPSKNSKKGFHYILVYKKKIYDPQEGVRGMKTFTDDKIKSVLKKSLFILEVKKRK